MTLDEEYQEALQKDLKAPCPRCGGVMEPWDLWLVTGSTCESCEWNYSEGSGCLL